MENQEKKHTITFEKDGHTYIFQVPDNVTYGQAIDAAVALIQGLADLARKAVVDSIKPGEVDAGTEQS